ncbi:MAG: hypothetical protein OK457_11690 [Thaumarchaeota archaeon]|nr:hypothetical protein [Nitrososphaerota archaeon]
MLEPSEQFSRNTLLFGSKFSIPNVRDLRAGPLSLELEDGVLRYVSIGSKEVVRRIYMALRDQNWNTIPTTFSDWKTRVGEDSFEIYFKAENHQGEIHFTWDGSLIGTSTGKISYSMDGRCLSRFNKRIIGLCALFPIEGFAGSSVGITNRDGTSHNAPFPRHISSEQPLPGFENFQEIQLEGENQSVKVRVRFDGDTFEMEDQRGFGDGSYKAYSIWEKSALPPEVSEGQKVFQSITISVDGSYEANPTKAFARTSKLDVDLSSPKTLPRIGLGTSSVLKRTLSPREEHLLEAMKLSHVRCDVDLTSVGWRIDLEQATRVISSLDLALELAVFVGSNAEDDLNVLDEELKRLRPKKNVSLLIFDKAEMASKRESVAAAHRIFGNQYTDVKIGGGTDRNFFDLNLLRPGFAPADLISYSANPQIHAFDIRSIVEALEGLSWTIKSAHEIYSENAITVSPVTLKPRFNPDETVPELPDIDGLPANVDSRQMSLFGAAWTAGSLKALAEYESRSLTYFETVGWRGVMETDEGPGLSEFPSEREMVFPLYHVLADISEMVGGDVYPVQSNQPFVVNALAIQKGNKMRLVVFNLTWDKQQTSFTGLPHIANSEVRVRRLNEYSTRDAMFDAENFRKKVGADPGLTAAGRKIVLDLSPFEVVTLDFEVSPQSFQA